MVTPSFSRKQVVFTMYIHYNVKVKFEWDAEKNLSNFSKHNIWFEEAQSIWADELSQEYFDEHHIESEEWFIRVGHSIRQRVLLVIFCERKHGEVIRIISARKATKKEKHNYEKGI